jgi:hypothetical protein
MNTSAEWSEVKNPKTGMTQAEMKEFIRNHFEEFVNRKNLRVGEMNFAPVLLITEPTSRRDCLRDLRALYSRRRRAQKGSRPAGKNRRSNCGG